MFGYIAHKNWFFFFFDLSNTHIKAHSEEKAIQLSLLNILSSKFCFYMTFLNRQINSDGFTFSHFQIIKGLHCKMIIIIMMVIFCQSIPSNSVLRCQHCPCHRQDDHEHGSACAGCPAQARGCWDWNPAPCLTRSTCRSWICDLEPRAPSPSILVRTPLETQSGENKPRQRWY